MAFCGKFLLCLISILSFSSIVHGRSYHFNTTSACQKLKAKYQIQISEPGSSEYQADIKENWSESCVEQSGCLFEPTSAEELAGGLKILTATKTKFAVRGGGHMPVPGAASIGDGVLISVEKLTTKQLSTDKKLAKLGPGLRWAAVYDWISPYNLGVLGGRYGPVGVPGLLLGGGINFFGSKYGWSASGIRNFEVVLANSTIVNANTQENADLFWALKGGSSNFGIVTRFDLATFPIEKIYGGTTVYKPEAIEEYLDAIAKFLVPGGGSDDVNASINPTLQLNVSSGDYTITSLACHLGGDPNPKAFADFEKIPVVSTDNSLRPDLKDFTNETSLPVYGDRSKRWLFASTSLKGTRNAVYLTNQTFFQTVASIPELKKVDGLLLGSTQQTITKAWLQAARASGGDAIDLDPANGNFIAYLIFAEWESAADDAIVKRWAQQMIDDTESAAKANHLFYPFRYLNDALGTEKIFNLYGDGRSLPKLRSIAKRYDPHAVFQNLMPGGFKIFPK